MEVNYVIMGKRIAQRRNQLKLKQHTLAEQLGISNNYLSGIERGKEKPSLEIFASLCNALEVTPDYLLMGAMHSNNISQDIFDGLRLCTKEDLDLVNHIVQFMIDRQSQAWNVDNFV